MLLACERCGLNNVAEAGSRHSELIRFHYNCMHNQQQAPFVYNRLQKLIIYVFINKKGIVVSNFLEVIVGEWWGAVEWLRLCALKLSLLFCKSTNQRHTKWLAQSLFLIRSLFPFCNHFKGGFVFPFFHDKAVAVTPHIYSKIVLKVQTQKTVVQPWRTLITCSCSSCTQKTFSDDYVFAVCKCHHCSMCTQTMVVEIWSTV